MSKADLNQVVRCIENRDPANGFAWEDAMDTNKLWSPLDRGRLPELVQLLERPSIWVKAYALRSIWRIGGDLDAYLGVICDCLQPRNTLGAFAINGEIVAIVRASILTGSVAARRYGAQLTREKAVDWFDRFIIWWTLRNQKRP
ncbi:MAG: hypothetical protein V4773_02580 [Verrucomicrobiota bacterium]